MKFHPTSKDPRTTGCPHLIFPFLDEPMAQRAVAEIKQHSKLAAKALAQSTWDTSSTSSLRICVPDEACDLQLRYFHLVPLAPALEVADRWRSLGVYLRNLRKAKGPEARQAVAVLLDNMPTEELATAIPAVWQSFLYRAYTFSHYKNAGDKKKSTDKGKAAAKKDSTPLYFYCGNSEKFPGAVTAAVARVEAMNAAVAWARDLVHTPAGDLLPKDFVAAVRKRIGRSTSNITVESLGRAKLTALKAGAILGVAEGSAAEPQLLHLRYVPQRSSAKAPRPLALIGKGVTFDSGGLSIKTATGMVDMKNDMAGAAAVAGFFVALASLPEAALPNFEIHGIIPLVENMISDRSMRPGDVLRSMAGTTIEITNTDAEGRLILADALTYAQKFKPRTIIDMATLTGACVSALGEHFAGIFCDSEALTQQLLAAASSSGDALWRLPIAAPLFRSLLDSPIADIKNSAGTYPGASLAAIFLKEFVADGIAWAHLDIAGPAYLSRDSLYRPKGATGFGIQLLLEYVSQQQRAKN